MTAGTRSNCFLRWRTRRPPTAETLAAGDHFFKMKGNELFKVAVRSMAEVSREVLEEAGLDAKDVKLFIPHQANQRITDAVANKLNVDESLVYSNISMHCNTSSASIPIALDECVEAGRVKPGDLVLLLPSVAASPGRSPDRW